MDKPYTVLEIGSGSFKLHKEGFFSEKFESSLGKNQGADGALSVEAIEISQNSLRNKILPFLESVDVKTSEVLVFATAAIRKATQDPQGSAQNFIASLKECGFKDIKIFTEAEECLYAAYGAMLNQKIDSCSILDTGGASHQLMELEEHQLKHKISIPLGSHSDLNRYKLANFLALGFQATDKLILIGTSGQILSALDLQKLGCNIEVTKGGTFSKLPQVQLTLEHLIYLREQLLERSVWARIEYLKNLIPDKSVHKLLVPFRLEVMPNAFAIVINCMETLSIKEILSSKTEARHYVSLQGFNLSL